MTFLDYGDGLGIWWDLHQDDWDLVGCYRELRLPVADLDSILRKALQGDQRLCPYTDYGVAADYIEDHWDHLLSVAQTAEGVDPEPLLRRLVDRLRLAFAEGQQ